MHVEPPLTPLIKSKHGGKSDKDFVKLEFGRDPTSAKSGLYEFLMALFDNGELGNFSLFVRNFNMTLAASRTLGMDVNV